MNSHFKSIFIALAVIFTSACIFLFNFFYREAKDAAIKRLNDEQMIHAKQAAQGIGYFFATWTRSLTSLSKMDEIIDNDAVGKRYMKLFYEANQEQIRSISRIDERGIIINNFPSNDVIGADISNQKHIRDLLRDQKPVISDVFWAVEGYEAVALLVPIFRGSVFKGSIGILINFENLAKRYLEVIKIGETGYAWVVSRDGTNLYSPVPGFTGKSMSENTKSFPSLMAMTNDMLKGHTGAAQYTFDRIGDRNVGKIRKYAVYMPIHIGNTFWSIAVASAEQDMLSGLISYRNKLAIVIGSLFIVGMLFSTLGTKAWFIVKEEEKRKQIEKKLQESERSSKKFSTVFHATPFAMSLATAPDSVLYDVNQAWLDLAGITRKDAVIGKPARDVDLLREAEPRERILNEFRLHGSVRNAEITTYDKAGVQRILLVNFDWVAIDGRKFILSSMQDITGRKSAEESLRRQAAELSAANQNLESFTHSITHDLRNPLHSILACTEVIKDSIPPDDGDVHKALGHIKHSAERMSQIITDLMSLTKIAIREVHCTNCNLSDIAHSIFEELKLIDPTRNVQCIIKPGLFADADETLIWMLMQNFIHNAWKFTSKKADARIEFGKNEEGLFPVYYVSDNGVGFDMAHAQKLFQPFQRLHSSQEYAGTGIGLTIVKRIIEKHGGTIRVEAEKDKGATFYFSLACSHNSAPPN